MFFDSFPFLQQHLNLTKCNTKQQISNLLDFPHLSYLLRLFFFYRKGKESKKIEEIKANHSISIERTCNPGASTGSRRQRVEKKIIISHYKCLIQSKIQRIYSSFDEEKHFNPVEP